MDRKDRKHEELSPEELWKKVSQQLSSKKYENASKHAYNTMFDFSSIQSEISKIHSEKCSNFILKTEPEKNNIEEFMENEISNKNEIFKIEIENSLINTPFFKEIEPKYPVQKNRKVPSFFPKNTYLQFSNPNFYKKFDIDTLFFCFYYFKGLPQQTYAAIRLKQCAWRYHLKYNMWFQRLEEPNLITSEYEKGEFLFFDYETTWNFMKKNDFVFEYMYLESSDYY